MILAVMNTNKNPTVVRYMVGFGGIIFRDMSNMEVVPPPPPSPHHHHGRPLPCRGNRVAAAVLHDVGPVYVHTIKYINLEISDGFSISSMTRGEECWTGEGGGGGGYILRLGPALVSAILGLVVY